MPYIGKSPSAGVRQRYQYTATAGQTTFSGTDLGNLTLTYTDNNFVDVFQNGVLLKGGGTDYTATSGTSVVLATGASVSDVIEIIVYDVFSVGNFFNRTDSDSRYYKHSLGEELILDADGDTSITADTDDQIDIKVGGSDRVKIEPTDFTIQLLRNDDTQGPTLNLFRDSASPADSDDLGTISFKGKNSADQETIYAEITAETRDVTDGTEDGYIDFNIPIAGTLTNVFEIGSTEVVVNEGSADIDFRVESNNNTVMLHVDAGNDHVNIGTTVADYGGVLNVESSDTNDTVVIVSTDDTNANGPILNLSRQSTSPANSDVMGKLRFTGKNDAGEDVEYANLNSRIMDVADGVEDGRLIFQTMLNGTLQNRIDIQSDETVINESSQSVDFRVEGDAATNLLFVDASEDSVAINSSTVGADSKFTVTGIKDGAFGRTAFRVRETDSTVTSDNTLSVFQFSGDGNATNGTYISFRDSAAEIGKINCASSSSVSYGTTSDYRLKENVKPMADVWDKVKALKPVNFTWKKDPSDPAVDGFIAHELQEIFPQAVTGEKDEMVTRADGTREMEAQGVDYGKLSTLLAKGLQEAMAKIETLEAKVTALESK